MEWSGQQQIQRLLQCVVLGTLQGFLLDILTGVACVRKRRKWLWTDVLFGPIAAIITFFGALVIMDGQLHPILLLGVFGGMALEHVSMGIVIRRTVACIRFWTAQSLCFLYRFFLRIGVAVGRLLVLRGRASKNTEKQRKICRFFKKKT